MKIEGVPDGYELVRIGRPNKGEFLLDGGNAVKESLGVEYAGCAIIRKLEPSYAERQAAWVKEHDVKVGDKVKVLRAAVSYESGWGNLWSCSLNDCVGKSKKVLGICGQQGIKITAESAIMSFQCAPYFVLEKVTPQTRPMTRDEFLAAWKQRGFCPLVGSEGIPWTISRVEQMHGGDPKIIRFENFYVSLSELTEYKFASDDSPLTITE